jgi:hypothetical protein
LEEDCAQKNDWLALSAFVADRLWHRDNLCSFGTTNSRTGSHQHIRSRERGIGGERGRDADRQCDNHAGHQRDAWGDQYGNAIDCHLWLQ